jgi:hypothetical protein
MYEPREPGRPRDPDDQPHAPESDTTQPSSDESTRLPLPGELHESPPLTRDRRERATRDPQDDLMDS